MANAYPHGRLHDSLTGAYLRPATEDEARRSRESDARADGHVEIGTVWRVVLRSCPRDLFAAGFDGNAFATEAEATAAAEELQANALPLDDSDAWIVMEYMDASGYVVDA